MYIWCVYDVYMTYILYIYIYIYHAYLLYISSICNVCIYIHNSWQSSVLGVFICPRSWMIGFGMAGAGDWESRTRMGTPSSDLKGTIQSFGDTIPLWQPDPYRWHLIGYSFTNPLCLGHSQVSLNSKGKILLLLLLDDDGDDDDDDDDDDDHDDDDVDFGFHPSLGCFGSLCLCFHFTFFVLKNA